MLIHDLYLVLTLHALIKHLYPVQQSVERIELHPCRLHSVHIPLEPPSLETMVNLLFKLTVEILTYNKYIQSQTSTFANSKGLAMHWSGYFACGERS